MGRAKSSMRKCNIPNCGVDARAQKHLIAIMLKTLPKLLLSVLAMGFAFGAAYAQAAPAVVTPKPPAKIEAKPAMWVVKDADTTIYLFGTVHILKPEISWFNGAVKSAFDGSDRLVLELVEPPPAVSQKLFEKLGVDHSGRTLRSKMSAGEKTTYEKAMAGLGFPIAPFDRYDPWAVAVTVDVMALTRNGFDAGSGAEQVLSAAAARQKKRVEGVESIEFQLSILDQLPEKTQMRFLIETIEDTQDMKNGMDQLVSAWAASDPEKLGILMNEGLSDPLIFNSLLTNRNANWAKWISTQMAKPGTTFMAVGAGHLSGPTSVQTLLSAYGLTATRLQ